MQVNIRKIVGPWQQGLVLDKHTSSSVCSGYNEYGHPVYDTTRSEVGEALYQLKYRGNWNQVQPLAVVLAQVIKANFPSVRFIVPMPASTQRQKQPVSELANAVGIILGFPVFHNILTKTYNGQSLKNLNTREEKDEALKNSFSIHDGITNQGKWDVLLIDDLFHTGASMEAACNMLKTYSKVNNVYVAALTWR